MEDFNHGTTHSWIPFYKTHTTYRGLFREAYYPGKKYLGYDYYTRGPRLGKFIAPLINQEMYDMFANENLMIIKKFHQEKYYIDRIIPRFKPIIELYEARKARYGKK